MRVLNVPEGGTHALCAANGYFGQISTAEENHGLEDE